MSCKTLIIPIGTALAVLIAQVVVWGNVCWSWIA